MSQITPSVWHSGGRQSQDRPIFYGRTAQSGRSTPLIAVLFERTQVEEHAESVCMALRILKPPHTGAFLEATGPLSDLGTKSGCCRASASRRSLPTASWCRLRPTSRTRQIQPASLDLRLGAKAYRVRASFLPGREATVAEDSPSCKTARDRPHHGAVLEKGCVYVVPLLEGLHLPDSVSGRANPKSSTGRLDIFTRLITDRPRCSTASWRLRRPTLRRDLAVHASRSRCANGLAPEPDPLPPRPPRARTDLPDPTRASPDRRPDARRGHADINRGRLALSVDLTAPAATVSSAIARSAIPASSTSTIGHYDPPTSGSRCRRAHDRA